MNLSAIPAKIIAGLVAAALAVLVVWAAFHFYEKSRSQGAQARVEASQAQAASNSAADAVSTVARSSEATAASEELTRTNEQQIRAADGANDKVNPAVRDAGIAALCRRQAYKDDPRCKGPSK